MSRTDSIVAISVTMAKDELDNDALLEALTKEELGELADFIDPDVSHDLCVLNIQRHCKRCRNEYR